MFDQILREGDIRADFSDELVHNESSHNFLLALLFIQAFFQRILGSHYLNENPSPWVWPTSVRVGIIFSLKQITIANHCLIFIDMCELQSPMVHSRKLEVITHLDTRRLGHLSWSADYTANFISDARDDIWEKTSGFTESLLKTEMPTNTILLLHQRQISFTLEILRFYLVTYFNVWYNWHINMVILVLNIK